jgi:hypothetical protein
MVNEFKSCKICSVRKNFIDFHKNLNADGRYNVCKKCHYERNQKVRKDPKHKERFKQYQKSNAMFRRYGIILSQYEEMVEKQNNKCLICGNEPLIDGKIQNRSLHIDHCHKTGKIRGLLCHLCNRGIGLFRERKDLIEKALKYIKKHQ